MTLFANTSLSLIDLHIHSPPFMAKPMEGIGSSGQLVRYVQSNCTANTAAGANPVTNVVTSENESLNHTSSA